MQSGLTEQDLRQLRAIVVDELIRRAEQIEDIQHGFARRAILKVAVAPHHFEILIECVFVPRCGGEGLCKQESRFEIGRVGGARGAPAGLLAPPRRAKATLRRAAGGREAKGSGRDAFQQWCGLRVSAAQHEHTRKPEQGRLGAGVVR